MANAAKSKASLWYGYLNAGARSSPVLRDTRMDTGNPKTLYLFNLVRGEILEYAREIVDKKLRELKPAESEFIAELDTGYKKARRIFKGRVSSISNTTKRSAAASREDIEHHAESEVNMDAADLLLDAEEI